MGALPAALTHLQAAAALDPQDAAPLLRAGELASQAGQPRLAVAHLRMALRRAPNRADALLLLALNLSKLPDPEGAETAADAACAARPEDAATAEIAGLVAIRAGRDLVARRRFDQALALESSRPRSLWGRAAAMPIIAADEAAESAICQQYLTDIAATEAAQAQDPQPADWLDAVQTAFARHYHGGDCLPEQQIHGRLLHRVMGAALASPAPRRPQGPGNKLRIGFLSAWFCDHTVTRLFRGWVEGLDPRRFTRVGLTLGHREDATTAALKGHFDAWVDLRGSLPQAVARLAEAGLDALIFPELGMDPATLRLAALRHAPVQLMAWGHPITSGLPTVDIFLSSAGMAPAPDRRFTWEHRVDLPGLSIPYRPPPAPDGPLDRQAHGLTPGRPLLLCTQNLAKYRPATDPLLVAVARRAPDALLVYVEDHRPTVTAAFRARLSGAFARAGLDPDAHLRFLPRLSGTDWMRLMATGDLFLDSPGWSGGNTSLEALSCGLPVLAFPGDSLRGRHSLAMVRELGLEALAPQSPAAWVDQAVALAGDGAQRARLSQEIQARSPALFADQRGVRALEAVLGEAVSAARHSAS